MTLTIFYDSACPLCAFEMHHLKKRDVHKRLRYEDIMADDFCERFPQLDWEALNARIHAMKSDGTMLIGLDVTYEAWRLVGRGWLYAPTRWPIFRWFADRVYLLFARHRYRISYWLTGQKRTLPSCPTCEIKKESYGK